MVTFDVIRDKQQATTYFATELSTYYGNARIGGKLVDVLGIKNQPLDEVFNSILTNYHPVNGEKLRPNQSKRLLFSFCISAPKPLSILSVYTDDTRLFDIHTKATNEAIEYIEKHAEVRKRKNKQRHSVKTRQTLYFACDHVLSRCNDPQLHTHVNFFNLTWDPEENGYKVLYIWESEYNENLGMRSEECWVSGLFFVTLQIECGMGNLGSGMIDWIIKLYR